MSDWFYYSPGFEDQNEIRDESFRLFLDTCWPNVDYFTFTSCADYHVSVERRYGDFCALKKELSSFFAGKITRNEWFGYGSGSSEMCIYRYHAEKKAKDIILSCYRDIFMTMPIDKPNLKNLRRFDDLCLFSERKLFFGSVSHEREAFIYPLTQQMLSSISSIGVWQPCKWRNEKDRRNIDKYKWT